MSTPYTRGRRVEWRVGEVLREEGYIVVRSARSLTPIDLVAIHPVRKVILLIQVKSGRSKLRREEVEALRSLRGTYEVKPMTTVREGRKLKLVEVV